LPITLRKVLLPLEDPFAVSHIDTNVASLPVYRLTVARPTNAVVRRFPEIYFGIEWIGLKILIAY
jgi:hypothetical protein